MKTKQQTISIDEVKALQDIRRIVFDRFHSGGFNAVEKFNLNVTLTLVHSALTKLENEVTK